MEEEEELWEDAGASNWFSAATAQTEIWGLICWFHVSAAFLFHSHSRNKV